MLGEIAKELTGKRKVVLVHGNADMDAMGSAYAISKAFPDADIFAPNGIDRITKVVVDKLDVKFLENCDISTYEQVIVVDTSSPEQLEMDQTVPDDAVVIDHHSITGKWDHIRHFHCEEGRTSCCEIVKDLLDTAGIEITRDMGLMLLGGMITDSGHFQFAKPELLLAFGDIMTRCGIDMDEAFDLTKAQPSMSEKIAMLKAIERTKFDRIGNYIVATSYGGSFEASSCRAIMGAGADVVFVGSQREDEFRLSARATQEVVRKGVHLGDIMKCISGETMTDGGGHGGAAGISGIGDVEAMLHICMKKTMEIFREIKAKDVLEKDRA